MNQLPIQLIQKVYSFDSTYREVFNIVLDELMLEVRQNKLLTNVLVNQEIDRNIFYWSASILLDNVFITM